MDQTSTKTASKPLSERIVVPMSSDMIAAIKDYWHDKRMDSRADAVRRLIELGLEAEKRVNRPGGK